MHRIEAYVTLAIIEIIIISILYLPILFLIKKKGIKVIRQISYILMFWSIFTIIDATIFFVLPITFKPERYILNLIPFSWITRINNMQYFITELLPNIMMFIPLGFFIPIVFERMRKLWKTVLTVAILTFSVEIFQYFIGRSSDIDDVIANILGGIIGYGIFIIFNYVLKNKKWWNKFIGIVK